MLKIIFYYFSTNFLYNLINLNIKINLSDFLFKKKTYFFKEIINIKKYHY